MSTKTATKIIVGRHYAESGYVGRIFRIRSKSKGWIMADVLGQELSIGMEASHWEGALRGKKNRWHVKRLRPVGIDTAKRKNLHPLGMDTGLKDQYREAMSVIRVN